MPIEDMVPKNFKVPFIFFFGDNDWMHRITQAMGPKKIIAEQTNGSKLFIIKNAGHQTQMMNPDGLVKKIIEEKYVFEKRFPQYLGSQYDVIPNEN